MDLTLRETLLLFADPVEMSACLEGIRSRTHAPYRAERVGTGRDAGHRAVHLLSEGERPSAVISLGSAQWLHLRDPPGVPVWAQDVRSESGNVLRPVLGVPGSLLDSLAFLRTHVVTVRQVVLDYQRAQELAATIGADCADQEGYPICRAAAARAIPCAVVRAAVELTHFGSDREHRGALEALLHRVGQAIAPVLEYLDRREQDRVAKAKSHSG